MPEIDENASRTGVVASVPARKGHTAPVRAGVVLAAGRSRRLSRVTKDQSKALLSFGGISLVQRAVQTLRQSGVERVIVVLGHDADAVEECLTDGGTEIVRAPEWERGNGASLSAAEALLDGEEQFAVLCADSVFAPAALEELLTATRPAVLVDPSPSPEVWEEGTKVDIQDDAAVAFGKSLASPAVDCGAFVLTPSVFAAYRRAADAGDYSLSGAITRLTADQPIEAVPIPREAWWQDIDTPEDLKSARSVLRRSLGKDTDGWVSRKLNRPISTRVTLALSPLKPSPNLLSIVTFAVGMWAAWSLSAGRALQGAVLAQLTSILDGTDGETARLQQRTSRFGATLDALLDRMVDAALYAGLWLWALDNPTPEYRIGVIVISILAWGVVSTSLEDASSVFEIPRRHEPRVIALFGGRDTRLLVLAVAALVSLPVVAIAAPLSMFVLAGLWRVAAVAAGRLEGRRGVGRAARRAPVGDAPAETARPDDGNAAAGRRHGRTAAAALLRTIRIALFPIVVIAAFVVVLPRLADLHQVWLLIRSLPWTAVLVLAGLAVWNLVTYWPFVMVSMPGLSLRQAALVCQSSTTVAMTVPAGGAVAVGVSYAMFSSWGFQAASIATSATATFVVGMSIKLLLPAIALLALAAEGGRVTGLASAAATGAVVVAVAAMAAPTLLRGDRVGRMAAAAVNTARRIVRMPPLPGIEKRIAAFRSQLGGLLRDRWLELSATGILSQLSVFLVMLVTMHIVGVAEHEVNWAEALAVFASVRLATSVPIVPGNVGFAELGYIGGLLLAGGDPTEVVSAVLLFRFLTFFIQIPIGAVTLLAWRRQTAAPTGAPV